MNGLLLLPMEDRCWGGSEILEGQDLGKDSRDNVMGRETVRKVRGGDFILMHIPHCLGP